MFVLNKLSESESESESFVSMFVVFSNFWNLCILGRTYTVFLCTSLLILNNEGTSVIYGTHLQCHVHHIKCIIY